MENVTADLTRDITIPDPSKAVTRVQPSVATVGDSGILMINGVNGNFTSGSVTIDMGEGVTIGAIEVISNITLKAHVHIDTAATAGTRDVVVHAGTTTVVGTALFTITEPSSAVIALDNTGKTTKEIQISDGTGTELVIPKGTTVNFPSVKDSVISYTAPFISSTDSVGGSGEKFTDVQRALQPFRADFQRQCHGSGPLPGPGCYRAQ